MQITSFRKRGDLKVVLNGDDGKAYHFLHAETAQAWMAANTTNIPTLASISPVTAVAGAADVTVTLTGTNFSASSEVLLNNAPFVRTYVSPTSMTIVIKPSLVASAHYEISVRNGIFQTPPKFFEVTPVL